MSRGGQIRAGDIICKVGRDVNLYVVVGLRKFVLMVMFFVLRVIC